MGIKKHAQEQSDSEYVKAVKEYEIQLSIALTYLYLYLYNNLSCSMCRLMHKQSFSLWQRIGILYKFSVDGRRRAKAVRILHNETKRVIELRRKMVNELQINSKDLGQFKVRLL